MTRRELITSGLGLAGILASQRCPAYIKSLIAASQTSFLGGTDKNQYVSDGLVAMWDGELGGLSDLTGNGYDLQPNGEYSITGNALEVSPNSSLVATGLGNALGDEYSIYFRSIGTTSNQPIYFSNNNRVYSMDLCALGYVVASGSYSAVYLARRIEQNFKSFCLVAKPDSTFVQYVDTGASKTVGKRFVPSPNFMIGNSQRMTKVQTMLIYSHALSDAEIAHNYKVDKARFGI